MGQFNKKLENLKFEIANEEVQFRHEKKKEEVETNVLTQEIALANHTHMPTRKHARTSLNNCSIAAAQKPQHSPL